MRLKGEGGGERDGGRGRVSGSHHLLDQLDVVLLREVVGLVAVLPLVAPFLEGVLEPVGEVRRWRRRRLGVVAALAW